MNKKVLTWLSVSIIPFLGIVVAIVLNIIDTEREKPLIVVLKSSVLEVGEKIIIIAGNDKTDRRGEEYLHVKFDGHVFRNAGKPLGRLNGKRNKWVFELKKYPMTSRLLKEGEHKISFGFEGTKYFSEQSITFVPRVKIPGKKIPGSTDTNSVILLIFLVIGGIVVLVLVGKYLLDKSRERDRTTKVEGSQEEKSVFFDD